MNAEVIGADASGPIFREGRLGLAVERKTMRAAIEQQLVDGLARAARADDERGAAGADAGELRLDRRDRPRREHAQALPDDELVRTFHVATGTAYYPTPSGVFSVVNMQAQPVVDAAELRLGARA